MTSNRRFPLALEPLARLKPDPFPEDPRTDRPAPVTPKLERYLSDLGPLPRQALFLGIASDGLPLLLNLHDPVPGPMLVIGEPGAGKTAFLRCIARSLIHTHGASEVQFGVITNRLEDWKEIEPSPHQAGIFDVHQGEAPDLILSLASWARSNRNGHQSVLLLVDDLEAAAGLDMQALQSLRWLLLRGPARRVWPILTLNADRYGQVMSWIDIFRARVFGRVTQARVARALGGDPASALDQLQPGVQFTLREHGGWLRFRLPSF